MFLLFRKVLILLMTILVFTPIGMLIYAQSNSSGLQNNIRYNEKTKLPKALYNVNSRQYSGSPSDIVREYLLENKQIFKLKDNLADFKIERIQTSPAGYHVGLRQEYDGIPVMGSESVVSINHENRISMVVNGYKPDINLNTKPNIVENEASRLAKSAVSNLTDKELLTTKADLVIYQDTTLAFKLTWKVAVQSSDRLNEYLILIDAHDGKTLKILNTMMYCTNEVEKIVENDKSQINDEMMPWSNGNNDYLTFTATTVNLVPPTYYIDGTGKVFDPDPGTALKDPNLQLWDNNDADYAAIQSAYKTVVLNDLNDDGSTYRLQGRYAHSMNLSYVPPPYVKQYVTSTNPDNFTFNRSQYGFEEVSAYYFIDKMRRYVGGLGFNPTWSYLGSNSTAIAFDAMAFNNQTAGYSPTNEYLLYGAPLNDFDDA